MAVTGFTISRLVISGPNKPEAALEFRPGLNVVAGASNTGKTYAFQAIDFLLGASRVPKQIPESNGYTTAYIELRPRERGILSIQRSLSGGDALSYAAEIDSIDSATPSAKLGGEHEKGNVDTISGRLLTLSGLFGKEVRKNARGEKRSLSFRDVAWLALIDEETIITDRSPALSGQYTDVTVEQAVLGLFLSGVDDSAIVTQEKPAQRTARIQAELGMLSQILVDRETRFKSFGIDLASIEPQRVRLQEAIRESSELLATTQSELDAVSEERDAMWSELDTASSRRLFLSEQLKRLRLLRDYYLSDQNRLTSSLEAGSAFEQLPTGECPVCGHIPLPGESNATDVRLNEFRAACAAEAAKITMLLRDLDKSVSVMQEEDSSLAMRERELKASLDKSNSRIGDLLGRKTKTEDTELSELLRVDSRLTEVAVVASDIVELQSRVTTTEQSLKAKTPKIKLEKKVETRTASKFCEVVEEILKAWKFPYSGKVSFDPARFDIVIGDQNRGSLGKGYRAVTYAAFSIGLMRYCRLVGLPHPGVVVLDTPLNPFKGPDKDSSERINQEVQDAFYSDLAADTSGDQVIVLENTEPPMTLRSAIAYTHFSGNPASARAGFFPPRPPGSA